MSSRTSAERVSKAQKRVRIRPAVPLIYEPRLKVDSNNPACKDARISNTRRNEGPTENSKEIEMPAQPKNALEKAAESPGHKLYDDHLPQLRDDSVKVVEPLCVDHIQEAKEREQESLDLPSKVTGKHGKETDEVEHEEAGSSFKDSQQGPLEGSERAGTTEESPRPPSRGAASRDPVPAMELRKSSPQTTRCHPSPISSGVSSRVISDDPQSYIESASNVPSAVYPLDTYPATSSQYPSYVSTISQQQMFPNAWAVPQYELRAQAPYAQAWSRVHHLNGLGGQPPPTPSASVDDGNAAFDPKLLEHISSSFNDEKYADLRLIVTHEKARFNEITFFLHKVLVSRSETLRGMIDEYARNNDKVDNKVVVRMRLNDRLITPTALESALRTCYGQAASTFLVSKSHVRAESHREQSITDMLEILGFAAAGHFLKLEEVALQALEKARKVIDWDNVEYGLSFGMESSAHRRKSPEASLLHDFAYSTSDGDLYSVDCAKYLLDLSLGFFVSFFPDTWIFDRTARPLPVVDRLPVTGNGLISHGHKSKLASIQFGQRPPEVDPKVMGRDNLISSIVLSVPLPQLRLIALTKVPSLLRQLPQIIDERENRRLAALHSEVHWDQRRLAKETEWYAVGFRESYTETGPDDGALGLSCEPVSIYRTAADEEEARKSEQASKNPL